MIVNEYRKYELLECVSMRNEYRKDELFTCGSIIQREVCMRANEYRSASTSASTSCCVARVSIIQREGSTSTASTSC